MRRKLTTLITVFFIIATACMPLMSASAETSYNYVKNGLEALYIGNNNTGSGQNKDATVWKDLSGNGYDIDLSNVDKQKVYFTDTGIYNDSTKVFIVTNSKDDKNKRILEVMNGDEFTVEVNLGDIESKGDQWNTFLNCTYDNFSLFRLINGDKLVVKTTQDDNHQNPRPQVDNGLDLFKNSTITVTFKYGGKLKVYVDGEFKQEVNVNYKLNCSDFFFGHSQENRTHATEYRAIRFYSRELTAEEVKANYEVDKAVLGKPYSDTSDTSSSDSSSTPASSSSSSSTSSTSSNASTSSASKPANSSSNTSSKSNPKTGDNFIYTYAIMGVAALASVMIVFRTRRA